MENQQTEALKIASQIELSTKCRFIGSAAQYENLLLAASSQLRQLHARVEELEAMLDAVGAGGVSAQRVTQKAATPSLDERKAFEEWARSRQLISESHGIRSESNMLGSFEEAWQARAALDADHIAQPRKMVAAQEPFGYFKAEPFGWRDCAETDEGAIALYEAPQPQADARDAGRWSEIGKSIERACGELPEDFEINIHLENGAGTASLLYPSGAECENFPHDDGFAGVVNAAIDAAIAAAKVEL